MFRTFLTFIGVLAVGAAISLLIATSIGGRTFTCQLTEKYVVAE